jgi:heat shock protein HslJ
MKRLCLLLIGLAGFVGACQSGPSYHGSTSPGAPLPSADAIRPSIPAPPVTYTGDIPCADCAVQRLTVTLRPDGIVLLRQTYKGVAAGADEHRYELGRWAVSGDGPTLLLQTGSGEPRRFVLTGADRIRMLARDGQEIRSQHNYDLTRSDRVDPIEDTMPLRGLFSYMADAASLTECRTGMRFQVAQERGYLTLERAYLEARRAPGEWLLIAFDGRVTRRPLGEGDTMKDAIVVERFDRISPGETCARQAVSTASLPNTYWRPVELAGKPVAVAAGEREPHLLLVPADSKLRGFAGCKQFQGRYDARENSLRFTGLATTRKFCDGAMDQEQQFLRALEATATYQIVGEALDLFDVNGTLLARFESRYLK